MTSCKTSLTSCRQEEKCSIWVGGKPQMPAVSRPIKKEVRVSGVFAATVITTGVLISLLIMTAGIALWNFQGTDKFLLLLAAAIGAGVLLPVGVITALDRIAEKRYRQAMQRTGWKMYEETLEAWQKVRLELSTAPPKQTTSRHSRLKRGA
jgi:hypothetical protein